MTTVWAVLGSAWEDTENNNEYSELVTWLSGVFATYNEAENAIAKAKGNHAERGEMFEIVAMELGKWQS